MGYVSFREGNLNQPDTILETNVPKKSVNQSNKQIGGINGYSPLVIFVQVGVLGVILGLYPTYGDILGNTRWSQNPNK